MHGRSLVPGTATGPALVLDEPLSIWGGLDPVTGSIVDRHHPQCGELVRGRVLVMPGGRGSSSSSTTLAETVRLGTAPAALALRDPDHILVVGALVARELYGQTVPIVHLDDGYETIATGVRLRVDPDGSVTPVD